MPANFELLPKEIFLHFLSFFSDKEKGKLARVCKNFNRKVNDPSSSFYKTKAKFEVLCQQIEADPNYQPDITIEEVTALVRNEKEVSKHTPPKIALAIKPLYLSGPLSKKGKFYQIIIEAFRGYMEDGESYQAWDTDSRKVIFISRETGEASIHWLVDLKNNKFSQGERFYPFSEYLNQECLHPQKNLAKTHQIKFGR